VDIHAANIRDAARALAYLDQIESPRMPGLSVVCHALGSIITRARYALEGGHPYDPPSPPVPIVCSPTSPESAPEESERGRIPDDLWAHDWAPM
jgi:hypothetical protein